MTHNHKHGRAIPHRGFHKLRLYYVATSNDQQQCHETPVNKSRLHPYSYLENLCCISRWATNSFRAIPVWRTYNIMSYRFFKDACISMENIFLTKNWHELDIATLIIDWLVSAVITVGFIKILWRTYYYICLSQHLNKAYPNPCRYKSIRVPMSSSGQFVVDTPIFKNYSSLYCLNCTSVTWNCPLAIITNTN